MAVKPLLKLLSVKLDSSLNFSLLSSFFHNSESSILTWEENILGNEGFGLLAVQQIYKGPCPLTLRFNMAWDLCIEPVATLLKKYCEGEL